MNLDYVTTKSGDKIHRRLPGRWATLCAHRVAGLSDEDEARRNPHRVCFRCWKKVQTMEANR